MKKSTVAIMSSLFGVMLIGILVVQAGWIVRVRQLNQKAFDDAVYKSLAAVVKQVGEKENFVFIKHQVETDTLLKQTKKLLGRQMNRHKKLRTNALSIPGNEMRVSITSDNGKETKTIVKIEKGKKGYKYQHSSVVIGAANEDSIPKSIVIATPPAPPVPPAIEAISALADRKGEVEIIMEKMMNLRDPDSVSISPKEIEKLLSEQLRQNNLPGKFTFALLSKDPRKSFVTFDTSIKGGLAPYKVNLYPNDLFGREITLALMLPVDATRITNEMWSAIGLSGFFTAAILALFIYSIRMLIRHKKMLEMKNDFINHMSHEFKTPLAGISLGADMLVTKTEQLRADDIRKIAATIKKQSNRLTKEVNDVLQNAVLEEKQHDQHTLFNIVDVAGTQVDLINPIAQERHANIQTYFSSDIILVKGNENQWHKVISNLLDNALKFSKENPEINFSIRTSGKKVLIECSDNGMGIAAKDLPHIFEKFFRSDYYKKSNIQGFGLGLSFAKSVVDAHKGKIWVESELNAGTKFSIELDAEA